MTADQTEDAQPSIETIRGRVANSPTDVLVHEERNTVFLKASGDVIVTDHHLAGLLLEELTEHFASEHPRLGLFQRETGAWHVNYQSEDRDEQVTFGGEGETIAAALRDLAERLDRRPEGGTTTVGHDATEGDR